jgi:hypothetical protein
MSRKNEEVGKALLIGSGVVLGLTILESSPNCDRGCKILAQHQAEHVLGDMLKLLVLGA